MASRRHRNASVGQQESCEGEDSESAKSGDWKNGAQAMKRRIDLVAEAQSYTYANMPGTVLKRYKDADLCEKDVSLVFLEDLCAWRGDLR